MAVSGVLAATLIALVGLPPMDLHGPLHRLGVMDPLCRGTRAARFTLRGEWAQAWRYNPLGIVAIAAALAATGRAVIGVVWRRWFTISVVWTPHRRRLCILFAVAVLILLQVRQQLLAPLLTSGR